MIDEYLTISDDKIIIEEKKSKFISESFFVSEKNEVKNILNKVRNKFNDATHHVYAYSLLDGISKSCDDKEPSGTAGIQILNNINNFKLKNVLIVITRYFGGIKLGTGGLSRTYFNCAKLLIEKSGIVKKKLCYEITINVTYKEYNKIMKRTDFKIIDSNFNYEVQVTFAVERKKLNEFKLLIKEISNDEKTLEINELKYI